MKDIADDLALIVRNAIDYINKLEQQINELKRNPVQEPVAWRFQSAVGGWAYGSEPPLGSKYPAYPLYTAPPQRKPLAEWQINDLMADIDPEDVCSWSFRQGVYAAEKHHGIKP